MGNSERRLSMASKREELDFLGIGDAGVYGYIKKKPTDPHITHISVQIPDRRLERYYARLRKGGVVVDKRPVFERDASVAIQEICMGPMLDIDAPAAQENDGSGRSRAMQNVGIDVYCVTWRELGARIGRRERNTIVWEDGTREVIDWGIQE